MLPIASAKHSHTECERDAIDYRQMADEIETAKAPKDTDVPWTLKIGGKMRYRPDGKLQQMIATPVFGYKKVTSASTTATASSGLQGALRRPILVGACCAKVTDRRTPAVDGQCSQVCYPSQVEHVFARQKKGSGPASVPLALPKPKPNQPWLTLRTTSTACHDKRVVKGGVCPEPLVEPKRASIAGMNPSKP